MSERIDFSTDRFAPAERFDAWRELSRPVVGIACDPLHEKDEPFQASMTVRHKGPLTDFRFETDAFHARRGEAEIAQRPWNSYMIYREHSAGVWFDIDGQEMTSRLGTLFIADPDRGFEVRPGKRYRHDVLVVPKAMIDCYLPKRDSSILRLLSSQTGTGALAAGYLDALGREWDKIAETDVAAVADVLCRLIGVACGAPAEVEANAVRNGRLMEAKRHIDRHLADPALSPASAAAALRISERALYALFEPTGTSFAAYVRARRLEACRAALLANPLRPVTDIVFAWGFGSMPSFYRAFHAAFGQSPSELRDSARIRSESCGN